jgi:hypothetical protein
MIIALLSVLAGYISQAVNTGSLFGVKTLPKAWLPYLTLIGTFLAAFVASISTASTVNEAAWFAALVAGLTSLTGTAVGVTVHQHMNATVSIAILFVACAAAPSAACTPAEINTLNTIFTDAQTACMAFALASAAIPPGTPVAQVANDVKAVCALANVAESDIETVISAFMQNQAATGTQPPPGSVYKPPARKTSMVVVPLFPRWALLPPRRFAA